MCKKSTKFNGIKMPTKSVKPVMLKRMKAGQKWE